LIEELQKHGCRVEFLDRPMSQDPHDQLRAAIEAVFASWNGERARRYRELEGIPDDLGTAVTVQAMVFGNRGEDSGTGVAFTRNPSTGEPEPYGDWLANAQGEDVVAGVRATEDLDGFRKQHAGLHAELMEALARLEEHYADSHVVSVLPEGLVPELSRGGAEQRTPLENRTKVPVLNANLVLRSTADRVALIAAGIGGGTQGPGLRVSGHGAQAPQRPFSRHGDLVPSAAQFSDDLLSEA
jgi:pyruvate,orthophosphate dikinase